MTRLKLVLLEAIFFCFVFSAEKAISQTTNSVLAVASAAKTEASLAANSANSIDNPNYSKPLAELIQASRMKYLEGYNLIRTGECDQARKYFDSAINLLLQSDWNIEKTPSLNAYFQELIQQIKEAESRYLFPPTDISENIEGTLSDDFENLDLMTISDNPELRKALAAGLTKSDYDIPITINEMVVKSLDFWLNRGRKFYADGLVRSGQYRPLIEQVFKEEAIPLDLINLAQVESFFKTQALSKAQAKGIWQFGKGTAVRYGLKVTRDLDERSDPEKSTRAAARYLNDLYAMFKDWNLALAAYNWGEAKVKRLMDRTGINDFWQLANLKKKFPEETRRHIPLIQASAILAKDPGKYGLPTEFYPPLVYATVSISKPIDLRAAAKVLSTSFDELKRLNPSLKGNATPANYQNFQLKVPVDSNPDAHEQLNALPKARLRTAAEFDGKHIVKKGESIYKIAQKYHVTEKSLLKENGLSSKSKIKVGDSLKVPTSVNPLGEKDKTENAAVTHKNPNKSKVYASKDKHTSETASEKKPTKKKNKKAASSSKNKKSIKKAATKQKAPK
jgi:membrane-bound lytic murein transglycosylase D